MQTLYGTKLKLCYRYTGMLETTRIRREGYSSRPLFADFIHRCKVLALPLAGSIPATAANCSQILKKVN